MLPVRMAIKLTQKHVDLPVFSRCVKGWTQWQPWCHTIPYCLLIDHGNILYTNVICQTVGRASTHVYLIWNVLLQFNTMSLYIHQFLLLPSYLVCSKCASACLLLVSSINIFLLDFTEVCTLIEAEFRNNIEVRSRLITLMPSKIQGKLECDSCKTLHLVVNLYIKIRLYHVLCVNRIQ